MFKSTKLLCGVAAFAGLLGAIAPVSAQDDTVTVGFAIAFTGALSPYDEGPYKAATLAIEQMNEKGGLLGRQIEIVRSDTKSDPGQGATAATDVLSQGAKMIMVTCDFDYGAPAALVAQAQDVLAFSSCAADPKFGVQGIGPNAYTLSSATLAQGTIIAEWAWDNGYRKPYVLKDTMIEYTKSVCDSFDRRWEALAGEAAPGHDTFHGVNDTTIAGQISRIEAASYGPDILIFCGAINGGSAIRQIRAAGIDLPIISGEGMDGAHWLEAIPDLSDFYVVTYGSVFGNDPDEAINQFVEAYTERWDAPPVTSHALTGQAVVEAWATAVERAGTFDTAAARTKLDSFEDEPLTIGPTTFTADTHINLGREMIILKVTEGKHEPVERRAPQVVPQMRF